MNANVLALSAAALLGVSPAPIHPRVIGMIQHHGDYVHILERFFGVIDSKGRGYLKARDLTLPGYHIAYPPVPYPQAQLQAPFRCVDVNRDGMISRQEYVEYGARAFDATVGNGWLDPVAFAHAISPRDGCK